MTATVQRSAYDPARFNRYSRIVVTPIQGAIGAEIECGDVRSLDAEAIAEVCQAWLDHLVVLFRGCVLTDDDLLRVGRYFGALEPSPPTSVSQQAQRPDPYVSIISNVIENGVSLGALGNDEAIWHTDMSNIPVPPSASILTSLEVPTSGGGETGFINMYRALETLPADLLSQIRGRTIYHDGGRNSAGVRRRHSISTSHPIIRTHPDTGRNALYLGRRRDSYIDGLPAAESDVLLDALWAHTSAQPAWHHDWKVGDTIVWDNRCAIHHRNSFDASARRVMHRTQTLGTAPFFSIEAASAAHPRSMLESDSNSK
ncbi:MAG: TauD/TfdA family dioxygenase [Betaproteobacteria bacterium]|nr:TauD/TfdA family dioxygenase [Betaproteobacteria bacterium]